MTPQQALSCLVPILGIVCKILPHFSWGVIDYLVEVLLQWFLESSPPDQGLLPLPMLDVLTRTSEWVDFLGTAYDFWLEVCASHPI